MALAYWILLAPGSVEELLGSTCRLRPLLPCLSSFGPAVFDLKCQDEVNMVALLAFLLHLFLIMTHFTLSS